MKIVKKENGIITQILESHEGEKPEGFEEISESEFQNFKDKSELESIEQTLKQAIPRYNELKELGEMRSTNENAEFQAMETKKTQLMTRRKQLLDNQA